MKTKFLKIGMPIAIFALAIMGAYASQKTESESFAPQVGWVDAPNPCSIEAECSTDFGPVCTMLHDGQIKQAFGKDNPKDATCSKELYRKLP